MDDIDTDTWRVATWLTPVSFQVVVAGLAGVMWLLARLPPFGPHGDFKQVGLCGIAITTPLWMWLGARLRSGPSPRRRGIGLSLAGSAAVLLAGGLAYLLLLVLLWDPE
ncbi:MAG TPA: hypothetical protein VFQ37_14920 [Mycobacterium sp.]|nr:hypothetical protein [Mycobacterium sp.]